MCLILVGIQAHPGSRVLLLANRDEMHARASAAAAPWQDDPRVLGGRDLVAGGSWLAVRSNGRFAAVTNLRNGAPVAAPRSRGDLVRDFVLGEASVPAYLAGLLPLLEQFAPFNLIAGDADGVFVLDGGTRRIRQFGPGLHVVGNGPLDSEWPKARRLRLSAAACMDKQASGISSLLSLLRDGAQAADDELPDTGIGLERERMLSSIFIEGERYGTRASTVLDIGSGGTIRFCERSFGPVAIEYGDSTWDGAVASGWQPVSGATAG